MKISLWVIGKTNEKYLAEGIQLYVKRLLNYTSFEIVEIKDIKAFSGTEDLKKKEADTILNKLKDDDTLVVLDENGKKFSSMEFSDFIAKNQLNGTKKMVFLVGGAFGVHNSLLQRASLTLSFSKMTFPHQMIRLFFAEQLYRAFTIIKNEKYHNP